MSAEIRQKVEIQHNTTQQRKTAKPNGYPEKINNIDKLLNKYKYFMFITEN